MANHSIPNAAGFILATDGLKPSITHCISTFEEGGDLFIGIGLDGRNPGGCDREASLRLTPQQVRDLQEGLGQLLRRIGLQ